MWVACSTAHTVCVMTRGARVSPTNVTCLTLVTSVIECLNDDRCWINGPTDTLQTRMARCTGEKEERKSQLTLSVKVKELKMSHSGYRQFVFVWLFALSFLARWKEEKKKKPVTWARQTNNLVYWRIQIESVFNRRRCCLSFRLYDNMSIEFDASRLTGSESYKGRSSLNSSRQLNQHRHLCNLLHPFMFTFLAPAKASSPSSSSSSRGTLADFSSPRLQAAHSLLFFFLHPANSILFMWVVSVWPVTSKPERGSTKVTALRLYNQLIHLRQEIENTQSKKASTLTWYTWEREKRWQWIIAQITHHFILRTPCLFFSSSDLLRRLVNFAISPIILSLSHCL